MEQAVLRLSTAMMSCGCDGDGDGEEDGEEADASCDLEGEEDLDLGQVLWLLHLLLHAGTR